MKEKMDMQKLQVFWEEQASKIPWFKKWTKALEWQEPFAKWFVGGKINASYACVDVHVKEGRQDKIAINWEDEAGNTEQWTYGNLYEKVNKFASVLQKMGVRKGDIIILYLPMIPESMAMMLACARLGAIHSVVFSGFSSKALEERINDTKSKFVITADGGVRRGKIINLKKIVDKAVENTPSIEKVLVIKRYEDKISCFQGRDIILNDVLAEANDYVEPVALESTHPLFILSTSGTTGKPKGIMHSTGGYLTYVRSTFQWAFDVKQDSQYWCAADIGWITGHSYIVYAPLLHGITSFMFEGTPNYPDAGIWWKMIEKYKISIFYTSPTALRLCKKFGNEWPDKYNLSSLKVLGSVGEPINPEVWNWYHKIIGKSQCLISDTWWQTETGGFMISPTPGRDLIKLKPGSATLPMPGIDAQVVDSDGKPVEKETKGFLVINKPWPGMTIGIYGDTERFKRVYWSKFKHCYYSGDYAIQDKDGYFWLLGRADEVLNIAGHRIGTAEIESAVVALDVIVEAAAIGIKDEIKGESVVIFVILKDGITRSENIKSLIKIAVQKNIGKFVTPRDVYFVDKLPKTRSGKIIRRLLKAVVEGNDVGDISMLEDEASVVEIKDSFYDMKSAVDIS